MKNNRIRNFTIDIHFRANAEIQKKFNFILQKLKQTDNNISAGKIHRLAMENFIKENKKLLDKDI